MGWDAKLLISGWTLSTDGLLKGFGLSTFNQPTAHNAVLGLSIRLTDRPTFANQTLMPVKNTGLACWTLTKGLAPVKRWPQTIIQQS